MGILSLRQGFPFGERLIVLLLSPSGRVARSAERGQDSTSSVGYRRQLPIGGLPLSWLPLACIKFCLQNFLRQKCEAFPYVKASPWGEAVRIADW